MATRMRGHGRSSCPKVDETFGLETLPPLRLFSILGCLLAAGCGSLLTVVNRSSLEFDVRQILKKAAVEPQQIQCRMVDTSRAGACTFRLSPLESEAIIRSLKLKDIAPSSIGDSYLAHLVAQREGSCITGNPGDLVTFAIAGRPKQLRLAGGSAFEYLILTVNKSTEEACLRTAYSYG